MKVVHLQQRWPHGLFAVCNQWWVENVLMVTDNLRKVTCKNCRRTKIFKNGGLAPLNLNP